MQWFLDECLICLSSLLYGSNTWASHAITECKLLGITWRDKVLNVDFLRCCDMVSLQAMLKWCRLHWLGHVFHMDTDHLLHQTLYSELANAKCKRGHPRACFTDAFQHNVKPFKADDKWETTHHDPSSRDSNCMMAAYAMKGTKEKSPKRWEIEARHHIRWTVFSVRSAGGVARAVLAWWPTATSINVSRLSARMTNANDDDANTYAIYEVTGINHVTRSIVHR